MHFFKRRITALLAAAALTGLCACGAAPGAETESPSASASPAGGLQVCCFAAGKADASLLWTDGGAVLIDTGESGFGGDIVGYLKAQGVEALDCLVITHFDQDHVGGAAKVLRSVPVARVLQSDCPKDSDEYAAYTAALERAGITPVTVREALSFTLDGASYTVDPPQKTGYGTDPSNNSSLIVSVQYGATRLLFTGDAEDARLQEFLAENAGTYDFLKVPYHGRWQDTLSDLIASVRPAWAVITCSDKQPEDDRTVSALEDAGAQVFLTRLGAVLLRSDGTSLTVQYET